MKRFLFGCGLLAAVSAVADWQVQDVYARQRRPWSTKVDIEFTASNPDGGCCCFGLVVSNGAEEVAVSEASLVGGGAVAFGEELVRMTWDPAVDHPGKEFPNARYYPVPQPCTAPPYLVVDLVTGAREFRGFGFAETVNADDLYRTQKLVCRYVPATTSDEWKALSGGNDYYLMGLEDSFTSNDSYAGVNNPEFARPQHPVKLTRGFYMGIYEFTQEQWFLTCGWRVGTFTNAADRATRPVETVSFPSIRGSAPKGNNWPADGHAVGSDSALGRLRARTGLAFDLPTEAQWEYACRAGTTGIRYAEPYGAISRVWHNSNPKGYEWYTNDLNLAVCTVAMGGTAKVGSYRPNAWGLYDMLGNVVEFCLDQSDVYSKPEKILYAAGLAVDPVGPTISNDPWRMGRGGCWWQYANNSTAPHRSVGLWGENNTVGFRVCLPESEVVK